VCDGFDVPRSTKARTEKTYSYSWAVRQLRSFQGLTMMNTASLVHPYDTTGNHLGHFRLPNLLPSSAASANHEFGISIHMLRRILFIEKLDWERVKKLGSTFLQLRLQELARRIDT
jgi:hypothetical protein